MPSCSIGDQRLTELLDRYGSRITARVAETDGGRFDVALTVAGVEIACLRLRGSRHPVLLYSSWQGELRGLGPSGSLVPLP